MQKIVEINKTQENTKRKEKKRKRKRKRKKRKKKKRKKKKITKKPTEESEHPQESSTNSNPDASSPTGLTMLLQLPSETTSPPTPSLTLDFTKKNKGTPFSKEFPSSPSNLDSDSPGITTTVPSSYTHSLLSSPLSPGITQLQSHSQIKSSPSSSNSTPSKV